MWGGSRANLRPLAQTDGKIRTSYWSNALDTACVIGLAVRIFLITTFVMSSTDPVQTTIILLLVACFIGLVTALYPAAFMSSVDFEQNSKSRQVWSFLKSLMAVPISGVTFVFCNNCL